MECDWHWSNAQIRRISLCSCHRHQEETWRQAQMHLQSHHHLDSLSTEVDYMNEGLKALYKFEYDLKVFCATSVSVEMLSPAVFVLHYLVPMLSFRFSEQREKIEYYFGIQDECRLLVNCFLGMVMIIWEMGYWFHDLRAKLRVGVGEAK